MHNISNAHFVGFFKASGVIAAVNVVGISLLEEEVLSTLIIPFSVWHSIFLITSTMFMWFNTNS